MTYNILMDDRKKRMEDFEKDKLEAAASLDSLLENFGENLYSRTKNAQDAEMPFDDITQYNNYLKDIAETNNAIEKVEEKKRRFKEIENAIESKEQEEKDRAAEMDALYRKLGKILLENSAYDDFTSLFKEQAEALTAKLESLDSRIKELENKNGSNVFTWIGKSAQGLVLRSFLSKAQESQEQLYHNIGERYSSRDSEGDESDIAEVRSDIERIRETSRAAANEISHLKDEKRVIAASFGIDGNPEKQIQNLQNRIKQTREDLRTLYKNFGAQAAGIMDAGLPSERKYFIDGIVTPEDSEIIGRAGKLSQSILEYDKAIGKLAASLSIDDEKVKIEKYQKAIDEKKNRIVEFEKAIVELENNVQDSEVRIQELQKQISE